MQHTDISIAILQATQDGNLLRGQDIALVQSAVNGRLNQQNEDALKTLLKEVTDGSYFERIRWLAGVTHLTRDAEGYVFWKGNRVEHFSHMSAEQLADAAQRLAQRCLQLEAIGFPTNSRTTLFESSYQATADTPWKQALQRYYTFFEMNGRVMAVFFRTPSAVEQLGRSHAFAIWVVAGKVQVENFDGGYEAFHSLQGRGAITAKHKDSFADVQTLLYRIGVTPERLQDELDGLSVAVTTAVDAAC